MGEPMRAPSDHKAVLRGRFREMRHTIEDRSERSNAIWDYVKAMPEVIAAKRLHVFTSIVGEPVTAPFVEWCRSIGKQVVAPDDAIDPTWPDVVVVPGLAFTSAGHRLGQGGGWYDRFLAGTRDECTTIGVGFDVQIVDRLPVEAHDVRLDHVVTESGVMRHRKSASPSLPTPPIPTPPFDLDQLARATAIVRRFMPPTPQYRWPLLDDRAGSNITVKHENHTPVGAFKVRGGLVYFDRLVRERPEVSGVVSATRGNHGQSLAFAGRAYDRAVTIVVPYGNSVEKNAAMRALGAEVLEFGADFQEAREYSVDLAVRRDLEPVPPFHPDLVLGVGTYALELFEGAGPIDTVYVPVGMGSGINALIAVRDLLGLPTSIVGVVAETAPATKLSFEAGHVVETSTALTFVDGVACRTPDANSIAGMIGGAARVVAVSDAATADAMRIIFRTTHNVAESAGAIGLAGLLSESPARRGSHCAFVLCGGNVDTEQFVRVLSGQTPS